MKKLFPLYYLYCINKECPVSIYRGITELEIPFSAENINRTYICTCCNQILVSSMDLKFRKDYKHQGRTLEGVQLVNKMEVNGHEKKSLPGVLFIALNDLQGICGAANACNDRPLLFEQIKYNLN